MTDDEMRTNVLSAVRCLGHEPPADIVNALQRGMIRGWAYTLTVLDGGERREEIEARFQLSGLDEPVEIHAGRRGGPWVAERVTRLGYPIPDGLGLSRTRREFRR